MRDILPHVAKSRPCRLDLGAWVVLLRERGEVGAAIGVIG